MMSLAEIERAHDVLANLVLSPQLENEMDDAARRLITTSLDVFCWVLGHEHNTTFAENLAAIEEALAEAGVEVVKGEPS